VPSEARLRFLNEVKAAVRASARRELVVFVHGYNVNFESCVKSAAQVWHTWMLRSAYSVGHPWIDACSRTAAGIRQPAALPCSWLHMLTYAVCATAMLDPAFTFALVRIVHCCCYWLASPLSLLLPFDRTLVHALLLVP
jgi:hypothetical protein